MLIRRTHELRYVLKDKDTGDVYFVVVFTLLLKEDVEKEEAEKAQQGPSKAVAQGKNGQEPADIQTSSDDLD